MEIDINKSRAAEDCGHGYLISSQKIPAIATKPSVKIHVLT
jgi:hypothetical protein